MYLGYRVPSDDIPQLIFKEQIHDADGCTYVSYDDITIYGRSRTNTIHISRAGRSLRKSINYGSETYAIRDVGDYSVIVLREVSQSEVCVSCPTDKIHTFLQMLGKLYGQCRINGKPQLDITPA